MTSDEIMQAAKEAEQALYNRSFTAYFAVIERLVMETEKRTIERCAVTADELRHPDGYSAETVDWCEGTKHAAAAIRALREQ